MNTQIIEKQTAIEENTIALTAASEKVTQAESEIISDEILSEEKLKVDMLAGQRLALENIETLTADAITKEKAVASNQILVTEALKKIAPTQKAYDIASAQYTVKTLLDTLQKDLDTLPEATLAQITARRNIETLSVVMNPINKIPENQLEDRKKLEALATERDAARKVIPAKNNVNYQSALSKYNTLVTNYSTALQKYNSTYASSTVYRTSLTYVQLLGKVNSYNAQVQKYEDLLGRYNMTYSNSTFTSAELTKQIATYKLAANSLAAKITVYNRTYSKTKTKTLENLAQEKEELEKTLISAKESHTAALNVHTQSQTDYNNNITLANTAKTAYSTQYKQSKLTIKQLDTLIQTAQEKYEKIVEGNNKRKEGILALRLEEKKLEIFGRQLE
jgi:hypothetical protein